MKKVLFLLLFLVILGAVKLNAQVTIGIDNPPHVGAVLDLSQAPVDLGLLLPRVALSDISVFSLSSTDMATANGMLVYNTSKTTIGGNGVTGLFAWDGSKWRPVSDGSARMTISTRSNLGMSNHLAAADGSEVINATIADADCEMSGQYQFILLAGNASIDPVSSVTPEFNLQFYQNHTGNQRTAVVQVINPCYKTATFLFYQEGAACGTAYHVKAISSFNNPQMCNNGSVYAYVSTVEDENAHPLSDAEMDALSYYWMLGNTQVATGRGVSLTRSGTYTVYANMEGCGTTSSISVTLAASGNAPAAHTMMVTNDGIICGNNAVKLQVLNVLNNESVKWFKNGIHQPSLTDNSILLSTADDAGNWYAAVADATSGCWSKPTNSAQVTYRSDGVTQSPPTAKINGKTFDDQSLTSVCAGSTVRLEIDQPTQYGDSRRFYWYMNDQLVGETTGDAIYVIPQSLTTCVISVKMTTTTDNCPVTVSTGELSININNVPSTPAILWQGSITPQGVICRNAPALLSSSILNGTTYQWFKNGNITTPIFESTTTHIFEATEVGTYTMRYQNAAGCWSLLSEPIEIIQSSIPTLQWSIEPDTAEIFNSSKTYRIVSAPAGTDYSWQILKNGSPYEPTNAGSSIIKITPLGDKTSVGISFPAKTDFPGSDLTNNGTELQDLELEVTASSPCGEAVLKKSFKLVEGCTPISSISVEATATKLMLGEVVQYTANVSTGTAPYWYQGWVYLENIKEVPGITWPSGTSYSGRGKLNISGNEIDFWCMPSDLPAYPNGIEAGQYKKLLIVPWTENKSFSVPTFAVGKHYVMIEAANNMVGKGDIMDNGTYEDNGSTNGCTTWKNPVKSTLKSLEVSMNPNNISSGVPTGVLNYTVFMGGKSCYDVHQTGDNATQAWDNNRLPLNIRPNDFSTTILGNYVFSYTFKGGFASIGSGNYGDLSKNTGTWNNIVPSIQYVVDDPNNLVVSVTGNGTENAVLTLKPSVIAAATGRTRNTALKLTLYAIYKYSGIYYKDAIVISIQDAACGCPAKMSGSSWIMAMCHAAGADYNTDPYGTAEGAYGAYYKWGNKTPAATHSNQNLNRVKAVTGTTWDMESQNPCPYGWRVATWAELSNIANTNLNARTTDSNGRQVRGYVPIRGGGYRVYALGDAHVLGIYENDNAHTWSANATSDSNTNNKYFYRTGDADLGGNYTKSYGEMVRCVQEGSTYTP